MLAEPFAVVGHHRDQRLRFQSQTIERVVQLTDQRVGVGHLAVVGPIAIA